MGTMKGIVNKLITTAGVPGGMMNRGRLGLLCGDYCLVQWRGGKRGITSTSWLSGKKNEGGEGGNNDHIKKGTFLEDRNSLGLSHSMYGKYQKVLPATVSPRLEIPELIVKPDYADRKDGIPSRPRAKKPGIKTAQEIELMRESCQIAKFVLEKTLEIAQPGITTDKLDKYAHDLIISEGAYPSALGYKKYPKSICTSVNNVACHGIPDSRKLQSGDIISIDVMAFKNGFHGDCAGTRTVGVVDSIGQNLIGVAQECTQAGILQCGPNVPFSRIGKAIEAHANFNSFHVVHVFTGHGIGKNIHESPDIYHYNRSTVQDTEEVMKPGMIFTIEPVITQGMELVRILSDGWTAISVDGARTAQFEHTILVTSKGFEVLTV